MSQSFVFDSLPSDLLRYLLLGFSGRPHLHSLVGVALSHSKQPGDIFSRIALDGLLAAWGENPFDGNCVAALAGNLDKLPPLDGTLLPLVKAVMAFWRPEVTADARAAMSGDGATQSAFLLGKLKAQPDSLFWWHHLYEYARINSEWKMLMGVIGSHSPHPVLTPLFSTAMASGLLAAGKSLPAFGMFMEAGSSFPVPALKGRMATALLRAGKDDEAAGVLRHCVQETPWNVGGWLRLYELNVEGGSQAALPDGRTMILAYSWNKAGDFAATLDSLAASDIGDARVRILDNGSTDGTPEVIRRCVDLLGRDRVEGITMPVNVGAPAARNWLMNLPEVRASDYVAYIDDDILLPPDWLGKLGAAVVRYRDAGVWGCKVVNHDGPARVQCGEHNLTPDQHGRQETLMSTIMLQDGDFGQADYVRPCASVTGCVHLFKTERLLENGGFDLRFSPTQYDDLERDLRMVLGGGYAVYTGHLAIPHKRKSGRASEVGQPESAGATANMHKLMAKYVPDEFEAMARTVDAVLLEDVQRKMAAVAD